jgi:hypothetical protein
MTEAQEQAPDPTAQTPQTQQVAQTPQTHQTPEPPSSPPPPARAPATLADDPLRRSPFLAGLLSLVPGLGHVYLGYTRLGFIHAAVVVLLLSFLAWAIPGPLITLAATFMAFFWMYGIVDAARRAMLVNQALLGRLELDLPAIGGEPGFRGSLIGGAAITLVGVLLLSHTLFDVSLRWVEDWWPVALIGVGVYLVYRGVQDRQREEQEDGGL